MTMKNWENAGSIEKWAENCKKQGLNPINECLRLKEIDHGTTEKGQWTLFKDTDGSLWAGFLQY